MRANAATANNARLAAAMAARDGDALPAVFAECAEIVDHPTGAVYDREGALRSMRSLLTARDPTYRQEPLATLGDALALSTVSYGASGLIGRTFDVGAYETDGIHCIEVDAHGRRRRNERFAVDHLGDAIARLYERYAELLPDGPERVRAATIARSFATLLDVGAFERDRFRTALAPDIEHVDRRTVGLGRISGADAFVSAIGALVELSEGFSARFDDVLVLRPDALLARVTIFGTDRASGGAFERPYLWLTIFGSNGLTARIELFEPDRDAEALARFDELTGDSTAPAAAPPRAGSRHEGRVRANAATAHMARVEAAIAARDASALGALFADDFEVIEHTTGATYDRRALLVTQRYLLSRKPGDGTCRYEPLATLGASLALYRETLSASGFADASFDVGPVERESLLVIEVDANGRCRRAQVFAADRLGDAVVRLYERYAEILPAGPERDRTVMIGRSIAAIEEMVWTDIAGEILAPDIAVVDRRTLGLGTGRGVETVVRANRTLRELTRDRAMRMDDVVGLRSDALLVLQTDSGIHRSSGGAYERQYLMLLTFGADGRVTRWEQFDADRDAEALARFDALVAEPPAAARIENAATRSSEALGTSAAPDPLAALARPNAATAAMDRVHAAYEARDWVAMRALFAPDAKIEDRRRHVLLSGDVDLWIEDWQRTARAGVVYRRQLVGTAGERMALERVLSTGAVAPHGGPFEIAYLGLIEVDERGRIAFGAALDVDDWRAAQREALARVIAGDPVAAASVGPILELIEGVNDRDLARVRAVVADDFVMEDHRRTGVGRIEGASGLVDSATVLWNLAPDAQFHAEHMLACERHGFVGAGRIVGTLAEGGGTFEIYTISVFAVERGRITRHDIFEPEDVDAALARFAELRPDPLRIPPNAATRANDRNVQAMERRDWDALEALCAPTLEFDDRRKGIRTTGGREMFIARGRLIGGAGTRTERTVLATAGDRLALEHVRWSGADDAVPFEMDSLSLTEVDAEGCIVAVIGFDPDDHRAASVELVDRHARSETSRWAPGAFFAFQRAVIARDLERCRAALPDGFVFDDRRRTGAGRLGSADEYITYLGTLFELSPDAIVEAVYLVATATHAALAVGPYPRHASGGWLVRIALGAPFPVPKRPLRRHRAVRARGPRPRAGALRGPAVGGGRVSCPRGFENPGDSGRPMVRSQALREALARGTLRQVVVRGQPVLCDRS